MSKTKLKKQGIAVDVEDDDLATVGFVKSQGGGSSDVVDSNTIFNHLFKDTVSFTASTVLTRDIFDPAYSDPVNEKNTFALTLNDPASSVSLTTLLNRITEIKLDTLTSSTGITFAKTDIYDFDEEKFKIVDISALGWDGEETVTLSLTLNADTSDILIQAWLDQYIDSATNEVVMGGFYQDSNLVHETAVDTSDVSLYSYITDVSILARISANVVISNKRDVDGENAVVELTLKKGTTVLRKSAVTVKNLISAAEYYTLTLEGVYVIVDPNDTLSLSIKSSVADIVQVENDAYQTYWNIERIKSTSSTTGSVRSYYVAAQTDVELTHNLNTKAVTVFAVRSSDDAQVTPTAVVNNDNSVEVSFGYSFTGNVYIISGQAFETFRFSDCVDIPSGVKFVNTGSGEQNALILKSPDGTQMYLKIGDDEAVTTGEFAAPGSPIPVTPPIGLLTTSYLPLSGSGIPSVTPSFIGQIYLDTTAKREYRAYGTSSSSDWLIVPVYKSGTETVNASDVTVTLPWSWVGGYIKIVKSLSTTKWAQDDNTTMQYLEASYDSITNGVQAGGAYSAIDQLGAVSGSNTIVARASNEDVTGIIKAATSNSFTLDRAATQIPMYIKWFVWA